MESPGAAEVVLGPGAADCRPLVAVQVELHLAFAPPPVVVGSPCDIHTCVVTAALDAVQHGKDILVGQGIDPTPLGVEVGHVLRHFRQGVVDLVIEPVGRFRTQVHDFNTGMFAKGHGPVAVQCADGVDRNGQRVHHDRFGPAVAEEVSQGGFDRRVVLVVPIGSEHQGPEVFRTACEPDVLNLPRTLNVRDWGHGLGRKVDAGGHLPAMAEFPRGIGPGPIGGAPALSGCAVHVLGRDGP